MDCSLPGFPVLHYLPDLLTLMSIESVMPSNYLILSCPLLLLPSVFPSIESFSKDLVVRVRWTKYWSFSVSPSNEYSGLIFFRIDWFNLLAVHGTLKSLLQHHNLKALILRLSGFFMVQLANDYWKNHSFEYSDLWPSSSVSEYIPNKLKTKIHVHRCSQQQH